MATEAVLNYLRSTNRPYSANDIMINLHKEYGKTAIQKALDSLVLDNKVIEKVYGKQKVYVIKQENNTEGIDDKIKEIDNDISLLDKEINEVDELLKNAETELKNIETSLTTEEVKKQIDIIKTQHSSLAFKLESLQNRYNDVKPISPKKLEEITKTKQLVVKEYKARKRICTDIIEAIMDGYPKPKKALFEEIGIETDEDVQFSLSS